MKDNNVTIRGRKTEILNEIGPICAELRRRCGKTMKDVARDTGYTIESVSAFEHGRSASLPLFLYYEDLADAYHACLQMLRGDDAE